MRRVLSGEEFPENANILKRGFFCGFCELELFRTTNGTWDSGITIKETRTKSEFRDHTFWILTDQEVIDMILPRII
jgi:hypothetical protein